MVKNDSKHPENQENEAQNLLNSGKFLKIIMPEYIIMLMTKLELSENLVIILFFVVFVPTEIYFKMNIHVRITKCTFTFFFKCLIWQINIIIYIWL